MGLKTEVEMAINRITCSLGKIAPEGNDFPLFISFHARKGSVIANEPSNA